MSLESDVATITGLWAALSRPHRTAKWKSDDVEDKVATLGWADFGDIEDLMLAHDDRLHIFNRSRIEKLLENLEIPVRWVTARPCNHDCLSSQCVSSYDLLFLLCQFERLGFVIDLTRFAELLSTKITAQESLTNSMLACLQYRRQRDRQPPLCLFSGFGFGPRRVERMITPRGYKVAHYAYHSGMQRLEVRAPKFRNKPEQKLVQCQECGWKYLSGNTDQIKRHRRFHKERISCLQPIKKMTATETERSGRLIRVDSKAAKWKRNEVWLRAREFKLEFGYDHIQWSHEGVSDPGAVGYLFLNESGLAVGACSFRRIEANYWKLDWIWFCPDERRKGHLQRSWNYLIATYGDFTIEKPISPPMQSFLQKNNFDAQ